MALGRLGGRRGGGHERTCSRAAGGLAAFKLGTRNAARDAHIGRIGVFPMRLRDPVRRSRALARISGVFHDRARHACNHPHELGIAIARCGTLWGMLGLPHMRGNDDHSKDRKASVVLPMRGKGAHEALERYLLCERSRARPVPQERKTCATRGFRKSMSNFPSNGGKVRMCCKANELMRVSLHPPALSASNATPSLLPVTPPWAIFYNVAVEVIRCAPVGGDATRAPTSARLAAVGCMTCARTPRPVSTTWPPHDTAHETQR